MGKLITLPSRKSSTRAVEVRPEDVSKMLYILEDAGAWGIVRSTLSKIAPDEVDEFERDAVLGRAGAHRLATIIGGALEVLQEEARG